MIDQNLFPRIVIRSIDLDLHNHKIQEYTNPHFKQQSAFTQIRPTPPRETKLSIDVELAFQSNKENSAFSTFIDKEFINKYLRISTILSDSVDTTNQIIKIFNSLPTNKFQTFEQQGLINIVTRSHVNIDFEADDKEDIKDNIVRINFSYDDIEPDYLSILAFSYFDIEEMERDLNISLDGNQEFQNISSTLAVENVFIDGNIVSESFVFYDEDGTLWTGPVEVISTNEEDNFFKYGTSIRLQATPVTNSVVMDYRPIRDLEKLNVELKNLVQTLTEKFDTVSIHNRTRQFNDSIFSDLFLTQDENANSRFCFGINYKNLILTKSKYGFLFQGQDSLKEKEVYKNSRIIDFSVYRQRVEQIKRDNSLGNTINDIDYFNETREKILVVNHSEPNYKQFAKKEFYLSTNVDDKLSGIIREIDTPFSDLRFFSISDEKLQFVTDGLYTYYIDIDIKDGTIEFIDNVYKQAREFETFLQDYLFEAESYGSYNLKTGKLTPTFITSLREREFPWRMHSVEFISILSFMFPELPHNIFSTITSILRPNSATLDGLRSLMKIASNFVFFLEKEFIDNSFIRNYSHKYLGSIVNRRNSSDYGIIKITKQFENPIVDSNLIKHKGMEFIEFEGENGVITYDNFDGLASIDRDKFVTRANNETRKYFTNTNVGINIRTENKNYVQFDNTNNNSLGYFSLSKIKFGKNSVTYLNNVNSFDSEKMAILELMTKDSNKVTNNIRTNSSLSENERTLNNLGFNFIQNMGLKFEKSGEEIQEKTVESDKIVSENFFKNDRTVSTVQETENVTNNTTFSTIFQNFKIGKGLSFNAKNRIKFNKIDTNNFGKRYDLKNPANIIDKLEMSSKSIAELPNQQKSIIMGSLGNEFVNSNIFVNKDSATVNSIQESNDTSFIVNYNNLVKIEALIGFSQSVNGSLIKRPAWVILNQEVIDNYPGMELICRARRYDSPLFSNDAKEVFNEIPIYNEYFIINLGKKQPEETLYNIKNKATQSIADTPYPLQNRSNSGVFMKKK